MNITHMIHYSMKGKLFIGKIAGERVCEAETREEAERMMVDIVAPEFAQFVDWIDTTYNNPALTERAHRATKIALIQKMQAHRNCWQVESQTEEDISYRVMDTGDGWYCSCADHQNGKIGQKHGAPYVSGLGNLCKHIMAVMMSYGLPNRNA